MNQSIVFRSAQSALVLILAGWIAACGDSSGANGVNGTNGANGANGLTALATVTAEAPGAHCTNGGNQISTGLDANANGVLDAAEVTNTQYVCNGAPGAATGTPGLTTLVLISSVPSGATCASGGKLIDIGLDSNRNGVLDGSEVSSSSAVCNGINGANGVNGASGTNGLTGLVEVVPESAGSNCPYGGSKSTSGLDANSNGTLDPSEVTNTQYICNGTPGGAGSNSLISIVTISAGATCATGGKAMSVGVDNNGNGILDVAEVTSTQYVCNGLNGTSGSNGSNGSNGTNGLATLIAMQSLSNGNAFCAYGGTQVDSGLDANSNGVLDVSEVASTAHVCNGAPGAAGNAGLAGAPGSTGAAGENSLITIAAEPAGANCTYGGSKVSSGLDANGDLVLQSSEVQSSNYVCNGPAGAMAWVDVTTTTPQQATPNTGYLADSDSLVTITLPTTPNLGDVVHVTGVGYGGWKIAQNTGQYILTRGLIGSHALGTVWADHPLGLETWAGIASSFDGSKLLAADSLGEQLFTSTNAGATWTLQIAPVSHWSAVASSSDGVKLVAVTSDADFVYISTNSGVTWSALGASTATAYASVAMSANGSVIVAAESTGVIDTSTDGGVTWSAGNSPALDWVQVTISSDGTHMAAANSDSVGIYTSTDSGTTWALQSGSPAVNFVSIASAANGQKLVASDDSELIYTSQDYGVTWSPVAPFGSGPLHLAESGDGSKAFAADRSGGHLYQSINSGSTWTQFPAGALPLAPTSGWQTIATSYSGNRLAVGGVFDDIYTTNADQTSMGAVGSLSGGQSDAVELQYVGNGQFIVIDDTLNNSSFLIL